ncbi:hypothetical protein BYT27DRAFT_7200394 [Phlegmacium glaucopus]|nr:hypothetical protein BYT27DRAFT_7200394 [Phlegmacium glaucopus]
MANSVQFTVDDTSPTILYSPFGDTFSTPNLSAGWNPYYTLSGFVPAPGDVGNGTSQHITSMNGSSCAIQWQGTGIQLFGNATFASYSITLDGAPFTPAATSDGVLANIDGLADAPHIVVLTAETPAVQDPPDSSMLVFEKAIITSSPAPANVSFRSQVINDNDIAFLGRWSFETAPTGDSFHTSQTLGDHAVTTFQGSTFLLQGKTSPNSGNYTVTIDNTTTTLSGRSSFTSYTSLLFFVSDLDSTLVHSVAIANSGGGGLSLLVGGFNTSMPYSTIITPPPLQDSPTSVVTSNKPFPSGTLAAFILAGILAFVLLSGLLFFFLVYRPRRRRRAFAETVRERSPKEHEAGVLDIGPELTRTAEVSSRIDLDNVRNGFSRWRRGAVEGSAGDGSLQIHFRHSDSLDEKEPSPLSEVQVDELSEDPSINSSAKRKARAKSKGKARQIIGRSWSPGLTLDFHRRSRRQSNNQVPSSPVAESLGYVSTFMAAEPSSPKKDVNVAPPSYAASVSIRDSNNNSNSNPSSHPSSMPSVPRSVSPFPGDHNRSYPAHNQESSGGFLLRGRESDFEPGSSTGHSPQFLKPPAATSMRSKDNRASTVEDNSDNNRGHVSLQQVIRDLSPRIPRHPYALQEDEESIQEPPSPQDITVLIPPSPMLPSNDDELVEVRDGVFLSVRTPSPFHLTFDARQLPQPSSDNSNSNSTGLSYVTASSISRPSGGSSGSYENPDGTRPLAYMPSGPEFVQGTSNPRFRLTPLSIPPAAATTNPPNISIEDSEGETSFLDFTSSREGSLASRSMRRSWSEERKRRSLYPLTIEGKSRWSNTTVPSVMSKSSNNGSGGGNGVSPGNGPSEGSQRIPPESQSTTFPIPVRFSNPPSMYPTITIGSNRRSRTSGLTSPGDTLHVHPPFDSLESPTESVPMSVSELHFRQSISEENVGFNSRRTTESSLVFVSSHPPLPTQQQQHDDFTPRPFDPSILVNRVLGLPSPTSTMTARPIGYSSAASTAASSLSPFARSTGYPATASTATSPSAFALRHDTPTRGDRPDSDNTGTDS